MNFEEMQSAWRSQRYGGPAEAAMREVLSGVEAVAKRHARVTAIKLTLVAAIVLFEAAWLVYRRAGSPLVTGGAAWCLAAIVAVCVLLWRTRFSVSRLPMAEPTAAFVDRAASMLKGHERAVRVYALALAIALIAGLNVMIAGLAVGGRAGAGMDHAIASVGPIVGYAMGTWLRARTVGAGNRRLLDQLGRARDSLLDARPEAASHR